MSDFKVTITDNSPEVMVALENAIKRGLLACGSKAEGYAKANCPVDTGRLRNSITHSMNGDREVQIGSAVEYAPYVELGTGIYYEGGRTTPWTYTDEKTGETHWTHGNPAQPYLKPALADHTSEYYELIKDSLKNA